MSGEETASPSLLGAESHAALVADLLQELSAAGITEAELGYGTLRLVLRRRPQGTQPARQVAAVPEQMPSLREGWTSVTAPLAGVYYNRETPDADPFVHVGSMVHAGQAVGLIESMKMFNEVTAEVGGIVREILVGNGDVVQATQPLLYLEPGDEGAAQPLISD
ncbi:MAG: hypothetical protein NVSMB65_10440 [Chloroflexota bacterium]